MQLVEYVSLIKETYYKHIPVNKEEFGIHVSYLYNRRQDYHLNGIAGGITYSPSILPNMKLIVKSSVKVLLHSSFLFFDCAIALTPYDGIPKAAAMLKYVDKFCAEETSPIPEAPSILDT